MDFQYLRSIRKYELEKVLPLIPEGSIILEIGAGMGSQARDLAERGFSVEAIDVEDSPYLEEREWPVRLYDGAKIPYPDNKFDLVFSSNVLEHIPRLEEFQEEIKRVLKPNGTAVHILPTGSWRFWTAITYYPYLVKQLLYLLKRDPRSDIPVEESRDQKSWEIFLKKWRKIFPGRHGERGNIFTELYLFSRFGWIKLFRKTGWRVETCHPAGLFYTGGLILGRLLSIRTRYLASRFLGSSCLIYVLKEL